MPLDPQTKALLDAIGAAGGPPLEEMGVSAARQMYRDMSPTGEGEAVARVEDRLVPGAAGEIRARTYTPPGEGPHGGLVYFHGGGWVIGDVETHDHFCRSLCRGAGVVIVSVDYRLAPEWKFPAAPEDCYAATCWTAAYAEDLGIDAARLAVAGDSAGGNLAAVVAQMARDRKGPPLCFQLLLCPVAEHAFDRPSYIENAEGYLLTRAGMKWFWEQYLDDPLQGESSLASPLLAETLEGLPAAHVATAEYDPLRDEGELYAARLADAGVSVSHHRYEGQIHNFFSMGHLIERGQAASRELIEVLRDAMSGGAE